MPDMPKQVPIIKAERIASIVSPAETQQPTASDKFAQRFNINNETLAQGLNLPIKPAPGEKQIIAETEQNLAKAQELRIAERRAFLKSKLAEIVAKDARNAQSQVVAQPTAPTSQPQQVVIKKAIVQPTKPSIPQQPAVVKPREATPTTVKPAVQEAPTAAKLPEFIVKKGTRIETLNRTAQGQKQVLGSSIETTKALETVKNPTFINLSPNTTRTITAETNKKPSAFERFIKFIQPKQTPQQEAANKTEATNSDLMTKLAKATPEIIKSQRDSFEKTLTEFRRPSPNKPDGLYDSQVRYVFDFELNEKGEFTQIPLLKMVPFGEGNVEYIGIGVAFLKTGPETGKAKPFLYLINLPGNAELVARKLLGRDAEVAKTEPYITKSNQPPTVISSKKLVKNPQKIK